MRGTLGDGLPEPGDVLAGKYRITRLLGRGGMGAVFAAQHEMLGEEVAIKLMLAEAMRGPEAVKRFVNEARAAAKIRGEHVVRVLDVGVLDDGRPYISMELMEGEDLGQVLERSGPLSPVTAVDYLLQGMEAIAQAHALGIVHRDLKPSNFCSQNCRSLRTE
jgi:serine/threonine protein kinase